MLRSSCVAHSQSRLTRITCGLLVAAGTVPVHAQSGPAVRPLGAVTRVSPAGLLGSVSVVRAMPGGRLLVNDVLKRRVVLLDSTFAVASVVADTTPATASAYGARAAGLVGFKGDSSLFIDPQSLSMMVISPGGEVGRVMAIPRPNDAPFMVGGPFGTPGVDPMGRFVYRGLSRPAMPSGPPPQPGSGAAFVMPEQPDTAPILRVHLGTRVLDTVAWVKIPRPQASIKQDEKGGMQITMKTNPMPMIDDWALLPDGTVAVLRGVDYHVDWYGPDGTKRSTPKTAFDWQRMNDDDKVRVLDSAKKAIEAARANGTLQINTGTAVGGAGAAAGGGGGGVAQVMTFRIDGAPGGGGGAPRTMNVAPPTLEMVAPAELPDYRPAFSTNAARVDSDGNLWVRTSRATTAGPVYDILGPDGVVRDRVQLPFGRVLSGFGPGVAYLGVRDESGARLEVARIR
jgi:hypothetical protein